jgi:hypothetical protein
LRQRILSVDQLNNESAGRQLRSRLRDLPCEYTSWLMKSVFGCTLNAMGSELTSAIAGLIGAGLGAGAAMWGNITAARTQLRQTQVQLQATVTAEETAVTRAIYADFLRAGVMFELAWRRLLISMREGISTAEERDQLYARVIELEHDRWTAYSILLLEAPEPVTSLARDLTNAYVELDSIAERTRKRISAEKDGSDVARWHEFNQAASKCGELTAKFAEGARALRAAAQSPVAIVPARRRGFRRQAQEGASVDNAH